MPVTGKIISAAIMANFSAKKLLGRDTVAIANSVGAGVATHITTPNMLTFSCSGAVGPTGVISSLVVAGISPTAMTSIMMSRAAQLGFGVGGRDTLSLFSAISKGVAAVLNGSVVQGSFAGLALGGGTAKLTKINAQVLTRLIQANLVSKGILGRDSRKLADCLSFGIVNQLRAGATYSILVTGAAAPVPPVGPVPIAGIPAIFSRIV